MGLNRSPEEGAGTTNAKHPLGRSAFWYLTPFSSPTLKPGSDKALVLRRADVLGTVRDFESSPLNDDASRHVLVKPAQRTDATMPVIQIPES